MDDKVYLMFTELKILNYNLFDADEETVNTIEDPDNPVLINSKYDFVGIETYNIFVNLFEIGGTILVTVFIYILTRILRFVMNFC